MSANPVPERVYNVLFLCTGNTARSIFAGSILKLPITRLDQIALGAKVRDIGRSNDASA